MLYDHSAAFWHLLLSATNPLQMLDAPSAELQLASMLLWLCIGYVVFPRQYKRLLVFLKHKLQHFQYTARR